VKAAVPFRGKLLPLSFDLAQDGLGRMVSVAEPFARSKHASRVYFFKI